MPNQTQTSTKTGNNRSNSRTHDSHHTNDVVESYADLVNELRLLTTVSALLFGFLLALGPRTNEVSDTEQWMFFAAIVSVATAISLFVLPSVYHHLQFPYSNLDKMQRRTHAFLMLGLPFLAVAFYLSLGIAVWDRVEEGAFLVAAIPIVAVTVALAWRRGLSDAM
jgi:hypothetical protein